MPELATYLLEPAGERAALALHFGRQGIGYEEAQETWPSDALFAALVAQAALLEGLDPAGTQPPAFVQPFLEDAPPLLHSSLFPRIATLPLLPRPALGLRFEDDALHQTLGKRLKRLRYLSPALFRAVCEGAPLGAAPLLVQDGQVWLTIDEARALPAPWCTLAGESDAQYRARLAAQPVWRIEPVPHVTVDRTSGASAFYEVGRVIFAPGCGLALLVACAPGSDDAMRQFELLLGLLGESGIGGKRSVGYGAFRVAHGPPFNYTAAGERAVLLSRFLPRRDEIALLQAPGSAYQLSNVGGWLLGPSGESRPRQVITVLAEGSVLDTQGRTLRGQIADVRPMSEHGPLTPHPVYRSGLALTLPVHAAEEAG
jgi:CRISPR-associated protein Csm4